MTITLLLAAAQVAILFFMMSVLVEWLPDTAREELHRRLSIIVALLAQIGLGTVACRVGMAWTNARFHYLIRTHQDWIGDFRSDITSAVAAAVMALAVLEILVLIGKTWEWLGLGAMRAVIGKIRAGIASAAVIVA
jgi:hypothetical protein